MKNPNILAAKEVIKFRKKLKSGRAEFFEIQNRLCSNSTMTEKYLNEVSRNTKSIVMILQSERIQSPDSDGYVTIATKKLKERIVSREHSLCVETAYGDQLSTFSIGSGCFVRGKEGRNDEYLIATAGHVIIGKGEDISNLRFVCGVILHDEHSYKKILKVHQSQVFEPVEGIIDSNAYFISSLGADWALIKVRRSYPDDDMEKIFQPEVVAIAENANHFGSRSPVYSIGHGLGLPMKVSYDGEVTINDLTKAYFECNLTLLGGNSGSPVFDALTHKLVGIYIRGTKKLAIKNRTCQKCSHENKCLVVKNEFNRIEGQECQRINNQMRQLIDEFG